MSESPVDIECFVLEAIEEDNHDAISIAEYIFGEKYAKAGMVNPVLYKMYTEKRVSKSRDKIPLWYSGEKDFSLDDIELSPLEEEIIEFLEEDGGKVKTVILKKHFKDQTTKINKILYDLQKLGLISKIANKNGTNPRWFISDNN